MGYTTSYYCKLLTKEGCECSIALLLFDDMSSLILLVIVPDPPFVALKIEYVRTCPRYC